MTQKYRFYFGYNNQDKKAVYTQQGQTISISEKSHDFMPKGCFCLIKWQTNSLIKSCTGQGSYWPSWWTSRYTALRFFLFRNIVCNTICYSWGNTLLIETPKKSQKHGTEIKFAIFQDYMLFWQFIIVKRHMPIPIKKVHPMAFKVLVIFPWLRFGIDKPQAENNFTQVLKICLSFFFLCINNNTLNLIVIFVFRV